MTTTTTDLRSDWILGGIPDGLMVLDLEGRIVYTNERFLQMIGRAGEDLRGRRCEEVLGEAACQRIDPRRMQPSCDVSQVHFNLELPGPGTERRSYCFTATSLLDADGQRVGVLEDFRGMDQLRETILGLEEVNRAIQREKERADRVMDSIADGVFTVDRDRRIRSFSGKMEQLTGIVAEEAVGRTCMEVLKGTKCAGDCPLAWSLANERPVDRCQEILRPEGGRALPVSVTTAFLHDEAGNTAGLTAVVHDRSEVERLRQELHERHSHRSIIGRSRPMREVFEIIETVADTDATVLIAGESGTGKEIVAQAIHHRSRRRDKPFVTLNCAALNDNLLESELFGHVRGAFTGAVADKAGRFELAAGGTILLDEIGDTTPALQAKLLRVLQEKTFERVGETRSRKADVRIIAATNRDLKRLVEEGKFREDLYYRLAVVPIQLPALRERREDVPLLVQHFIDKYRARYFKGREEEFEGISNRALALMMEYDWPGNVRELEHAVEYAMISTTSGRIERAFLPAPLRRLQPPDAGAPAPPAADEALPYAAKAAPRPAADTDETATLLRALERSRWNATRTARQLGISRTTLWRRMKRLDLGRTAP